MQVTFKPNAEKSNTVGCLVLVVLWVRCRRAASSGDYCDKDLHYLVQPMMRKGSMRLGATISCKCVSVFEHKSMRK